MNFTDQQGPDGSLTYERLNDVQMWDNLAGASYNVPRYKAVTTLSPSGQRVQDINNQTEENIATIGRDQSSRIGGILGAPINFDGVSKLPDASTYMPTDYSADRDKVEGALMERLNPQIARDRSAMESKLINQGLRPGSQAYNDAVSELGRNSNDARLGAILNAGTEQSRMLNERERGYNMALRGRQQGVQEVLTQRNQPLNEISALMSGSQVSMPQFVNTPQTQVAGTDYQGAVYQTYQGQMDAYKQKVASQNAMMGGLFSMAGSLGGMAIYKSDRRLKRDIVRVGKLANGLPTYLFRYLDGDAVFHGLMSDDVRKVKPEAVIVMADGFDAVDYNLATEV